MRRISHIPGAVLPTVMVVSVLLLLTVIAVASLWEADFLFFSKQRYAAMQRANLESGFTLYQEHPDETFASLDADSTLVLYDSVAHSRIMIRRRAWGLYETVSISSCDAGIHSSKILGRRTAYKDDITFYYRNNNTALTLTGKTHLKGHTRMPRSGVIYGQMGSVFFNGEKIEDGRMKESDKELPEPEAGAVSAVNELQALTEGRFDLLQDDSLRHGFRESEPLIFSVDRTLEYRNLSGNIILVGQDIEIDASCKFNDIIIVGENIHIGDGFTGSLQAFAMDSINIEENVRLDYPSGLYSEKYIGIGDGTQVNGYAIVNLKDEPNVRNANYEQSRLATVRGLVYVSGIAQLQGIVSGTVFLGKAVYYSPRGYYENMIYDATVLENSEMAAPLWLGGPPERKEAKWVY